VDRNVTGSGLTGLAPEGIRVLVADGNAGGVHVLSEMLSRGRMDTVEVDGVEPALAALREASNTRRPFALVILDTRISGGRGLELARSLRGREAASGPAVIALTFKAELKEAEQYRAAGVCAYLQQPVTQPELMNAIAAALVSESLGRLNAFSNSGAIPPFDRVENPTIIREPSPGAFDGSLFDSDPQFLTEIVSLFLKTYPQLLYAIEDAISRKDAPGLCQAAHSLKGAVGNFGAKAVVEQAAALETMGKTGNLSCAMEGSAALRARMREFEPELRAALDIAMKQVVM
jgi:CheY-like chemotaxis protein/HPt (histidine-containing phosphotransfer) domain-containing protein